ncbi:MAG: hypothetical protein J07HQX50_02695 [Haloquadratum sp. J07HQX50]|nr:MAG: hypothetical protein J07HQX50_02695 [Haloquadratum sp. J07HQX50]
MRQVDLENTSRRCSTCLRTLTTARAKPSTGRDADTRAAPTTTPWRTSACDIFVAPKPGANEGTLLGVRLDSATLNVNGESECLPRQRLERESTLNHSRLRMGSSNLIFVTRIIAGFDPTSRVYLPRQLMNGMFRGVLRWTYRTEIAALVALSSIRRRWLCISRGRLQWFLILPCDAT